MSLRALYEDFREHGDFFTPGPRGRVWSAWSALATWPRELYWRWRNRRQAR